MSALAGIVLAFLIGSIPFGLVIGRLFFKTDIRKSGSGNIGTVNALRTLGKAGGALVLVLDVAKGFFPVLLVHDAGTALAVAVAAAAVLGHVFSPWLRFRGGKGVATALGTLLALFWPAAAVFALVWLATVGLTRYASLGSILGTLLAAATYAALNPTIAVIAYCLLLTVLIAYAHRENIARLRSGTENRFSLSSAGAK